MKKQPTTKQRFDAIIKHADLMSSNAGLDDVQTSISKNSTINGIMECINHLKEVHNAGGDAGEFLNELEQLCAKSIADQLVEVFSKLKSKAESITDDIVKPEEN